MLATMKAASLSQCLLYVCRKLKKLSNNVKERAEKDTVNHILKTLLWFHCFYMSRTIYYVGHEIIEMKFNWIYYLNCFCITQKVSFALRIKKRQFDWLVPPVNSLVETNFMNYLFISKYLFRHMCLWGLWLWGLWISSLNMK